MGRGCGEADRVCSEDIGRERASVAIAPEEVVYGGCQRKKVIARSKLSICMLQQHVRSREFDKKFPKRPSRSEVEWKWEAVWCDRRRFEEERVTR